jgi:hypothetical protein
MNELKAQLAQAIADRSKAFADRDKAFADWRKAVAEITRIEDLIEEGETYEQSN